MWPIGCSLFVENATAQVLGSNKLLTNSVSPSSMINRADLFTPTNPLLKSRTDPIEARWERFIEAILFSEIGTGDSADSIGGEQMPRQWLENIVFSSFYSSDLAGASNPENPTMAERFDGMERALEDVTALGFGMIIQSFRSLTLDALKITTGGSDGLNDVAKTWKPVTALVSGQRATVLGQLRVNGVQVIIGTLCVITLTLAIILVLAPDFSDDRRVRKDGVVRDGSVIDLISLVNNSTLPSIIANDGLGDVYGSNAIVKVNDERRKIAERTKIT